MVIDSSAILAIILGEPEAEQFAGRIASDHARRMSAVNWLETLMVAESRLGEESADETLLIMQQFGIKSVAFDSEHVFEAQRAWRRFGEGHHPAALNMADCAAYAAATIAGEPLLFKGDDFAKTDVAQVEWK